LAAERNVGAEAPTPEKSTIYANGKYGVDIILRSEWGVERGVD
jgi:hypothetical protein